MLIVLFCFYILDQEPVSETFVFFPVQDFLVLVQLQGVPAQGGGGHLPQYRGVQLQERLKEEGSIGKNYNCFDRALILVTRMNSI